MDIPNPPEEPEVKNIIDKLANFVARNGTEFEKMTKEKQKGNSKFAFLFGGKHYHYYQYKLSTEQQNQNQQKASLAAQQVMAQEAMVQQSLQNAPWQQHQPPMQPPMGGFQQYNQPPLQMPIRMPPMPPNMPPWQQNQPMSKQPPMSMPSFPPPSNSNNMVGQNSAQSFMNIPPPAILNPNMLQQPPPHMQLQQNFPPNMFQPHQGNPPQKHPIPPLMQQTLDPSIVRDSEKKPEDPIKEGEEKLRSAIEDAEKKIEDSKNNLAQQYQVLMQQQQEKIEIAIIQAQDMKLSKLAGATGVIVNDFDTVLHPIINACTKDSISVGKSWILSNSKTASHCDVVGLHLLKKIMDAEKLPEDESLGTKSKFNTQLHIIYLINDVLHHASRKHLVDLSCSLQKVILPIFCMATANAPEAKKERLTKLLTLWDKFQYFNRDILHKLKDPSSSLSEYQANLIIEHADRVKEVQTDIQKQYNQYQQQHDEYAAHVNQQVENQKVALEKLKKEAEQARIEKENEKEANATSNNQRGFGNFEGNEPPWNSSGNFDMPIQFEYGHGSSNQGPPEVIDYSHQRGPRAPWQGGQEGPPWSSGNAPGPRGPPQRGPPVIDPNDPSLIPSAPYYDLPAGLMCPLVKLEEMEYRPLDPTLIRLPPPLPPSDRLLAAVEAFYGPPSHERPRNVDGWEHNGLFEFYRAKVRAKRRKEGGKVSRSPSRSKSRSKSRTPPRSRKRSISRSRSRSSSSGRSRSRSRSASSRSHSRSRSRSKSQSRSPRRRSPDDISRGRSATPPSLSSSFFNLARDQDNKLGEQNRGAQMLKRMGWSGAGLGVNEQGIEDPIQAGEVREKYDQFKGLGMAVNDPYENFRKSKSQGFITRIRSRDKERDKNDTPSKRKNED